MACVLIWAGHIVYRVIHLSSTARSLINTVQSGNLDTSIITSSISSMTDDLVAIQVNVRPVYPLLSLGSYIPGVGPYLGQVKPLLEFSSGLGRAGNLLMTNFEPVLKSSGQAAGGLSTTEKLFNAIQSNLSAINQASAIIDQVSSYRQKIDPNLIPSSYRNYYLTLDKYFPAIQAGIPALQQIPLLMGENGNQNYLILAQNRDEMRATGGFISGIGLAALNKGKIVSFSIGDSYAIDDYSKGYPKPPAPLKQFMLAGYWVTRDANWSPDFPTSAVQAQKLYTLSTGTAVKGTVAFDQLAVKDLLDVIGPVNLAGYPDQISSANVEDFMRMAWAPDPSTGITMQWWENRKNFMGELGKVLLGKVLSMGDQKNLAKTALALVDMIKSGHLLVYIDQPEITSLLASVRLDGALHPEAGNFVYLVDSNIGFNKVDTVVDRSLSYAIDLTNPNAPTAQITVTYRHTVQQDVPCVQEATYGKGTYTDMQTRCYWDYWRIYLPAGSQLLSSSVLPVPGKELLSGKDWTGQVESSQAEDNLAVLSGLMVLPPNSQQETQLKVSLPTSILTRDENRGSIFQLQVPKQAGLDQLPLTVKIILPPGVSIQPGYTDWRKEGDNIWTWSGNLTQLRVVSLGFCCVQ
ncbi:MAG TPA: DUF4012 domain-containing protein [Anaerolineaceae bacterium]|nr:DUF4012 domain-containing protein [Anaerolineaceae bacterium]